MDNFKYSDYIIWDGYSLSKYRPEIHAFKDATYSIKEELIIIDEHHPINDDTYTIRFFGCKKGFPSYEVHENGNAYGLFTRSFYNSIEDIPLLIFLNKINKRMALYGVNQKSEVICPYFFLEISIKLILCTNIWKKALFIQKFDCCRTPYSKEFHDKLKTRCKEKNKYYEGINEIAFFLRNGTIPVMTPENKLAIVYPKKLIVNLDKIKIYININEHPPPHFHITSPDIDASFTIDNCKQLNGKISNQNLKKIQYWFYYCRGRQKLIDEWNNTRPGNCPVGPFISKKT